MIKVRQIKIDVSHKNKEIILKKVAQILKIAPQKIGNWKILKESIDARDENNIFYVYEVAVEVQSDEEVLKRIKNDNVVKYEEEKYLLPKAGNNPLKTPIVIIGCGPAGLFCAYILAEAGYKPIIIEQGKKVEERNIDVNKFWNQGILNVLSNVQFGEGGAGTFSDGKLNTLIKDKRHLGKKVFEIFVSCGAPEEILYVHNPHIGTDELKKVIVNMRQKISKMGGIFKFNTKLTDIVIKDGSLEKIIVNNEEEIVTNNLVLTIGHSARDTFYMLHAKGLNLEAKPFAIGLRVMHDQEMINKNQYRDKVQYLPNASYKLTYTTHDQRGIYSFCMCPGGYVINASSEEKALVVNGMSNYKRDSGVANSAIVVTINNKDYGEGIFAGLEFQRNLERKMYALAKGNIPLQLWEDFKNNKKSREFKGIKPMVKGSYEFANLRECLPDFLVDSLLEAMPEFGKKIKGFDKEDVILAGLESRTSCPIRIIRDINYEANIKGIYPGGEGAGYAGGITSSAIDGIKIAESLISKYKI